MAKGSEKKTQAAAKPASKEKKEAAKPKGGVEAKAEAPKPVAKPKAEPKGKTVKVQLRTERYVAAENARGRRDKRLAPWNHFVKYNGVTYKAGDEFECDEALADRLIASGTAQKAGEKLTPSVSRELQRRPIKPMHGVKSRAEVEGMIPVYEQSKGNKGEWADADDLDDV